MTEPKLSIPCGTNAHHACRGKSDRQYVGARRMTPPDYGRTFVCQCACHRASDDSDSQDP